MDEKLLKILAKVNYPGMERDIVDFHMIEKAEISPDGEVSILIKNITDQGKFNTIKEKILSLVKEAGLGEKCNVELKKASPPGQAPKPGVKTSKLLSNIKNVIAVGSGKGGVGKSTVAVNLAIATAKKGYSVGLLDADILGPSIPTMMGTEDEQPFADEQKKIMPIENHGIKMMSIGYFVEKNMPVIWRGPLVVGALKQFMTDVRWPDLDYLFIDLPPGTGDVQLTLTQEAKIDGVVIVTTPQKVAYIDAIKGIVMFKRLEIPVIGIIENMSYFQCPDTGKKHHIFGKGGGELVSKEHDVPLIGQIPIDGSITEHGDSGHPIVDSLPDSAITKAYMEAVDNLVKGGNDRS